VSVVVVFVARVVQRRPWLRTAPFSEILLLLWLGLLATQAAAHLDRSFTVQAYGARDWLLYLAPFFVGLYAPLSERSAASVFRTLVLVGVATSAIGVMEYVLIPTPVHIEIGVVRYFNDLLGQTFTPFFGGLPPNYYTSFAGLAVRRAVSVYLSGQGFALPFLVFMPAALLWALHRRSRTALAAALLTGVALLLTITRMTIFVCALQCVVLLWIAGRRRMVALMFVAVLTVFAVSWVSVPRVRRYVVSTVTFSDSSSSARPEHAMRMFESARKFPLGEGLGTSGQTATQFGLEEGGWSTELGYGKVIQTLGIPGLLLWMAWFIGILRSAWQVAGNSVGMQRCVALLVFAAAGGIMLNNLTAPPDQSPVVIYVFSWLAGTVSAWAGKTQVSSV
jgi:hypothetical protein